MSLISSKTFADACDFVICHAYGDLGRVCKPAKTPKRIFVAGEYSVFERALPLLTSFEDKYELVYHYSDPSFDRFKFEVIRPYVTKIYAQNCEFDHPMVKKLPLGFPDGKVPRRVEGPRNKDILCYVNLGLYNDRELKFAMCRSIRQKVYEYFRDKPWATVDEAPIPFEEFSEKLNRAEYVVCPVGFGLDTMRFYESAWVGATPIVTHSGIEEDVHREFNPLVVDSFEDVTEELLRTHERRIAGDDKFNVDFWLK
jgi:hypothetical protein